MGISEEIISNGLLKNCSVFVNGIADGLDVMNVGSTNAFADFNYSCVQKLSAANLALPNQAQSENILILESFISRLKHNGVVFIPISLFTSCVGDRDRSTSHRYRDYAILPPDKIREYSQDTAKAINTLICLHPEVIDREEWGNQLESPEEMDKHATFILKRWWMEPFEISDLSGIMSEDNYRRLIETALSIRKQCKICFHYGARPVLILMPVSAYLRRHIPDSFISNYVHGLVEKIGLSNVLTLDYLSAEVWQNPQLYRDSFVMNNSGSLCFTHDVIAKTVQY